MLCEAQTIRHFTVSYYVIVYIYLCCPATFLHFNLPKKGINISVVRDALTSNYSMIERNHSVNNIYSSTKVLPYVYLCREKYSPYYYIGYRYANYVPSTDDFGTYYYTSNNYVKENFNNFEHSIVAEFYTKDDAYKFESELINEMGSEFLINSQRHKKTKIYESVKVDNSPKLCALPGCNKIHTNWRMKCCCKSHSQMYAGQQRHKKYTK